MIKQLAHGESETALNLLFESDHIIVVDKPAGWLSVPSRQGSADLRPCVGKALEEALATRLWPVHRLDFEVTGLLLFAKNAAAHRRANEWFESRQVHKTYEALTVATGADAFRDKALWTSRLLRGKKRAYESPLGKNAETSACVINQVKTAAGIAALWQLEPHTGRPHQLRYELARHGFPILGDRLYGSDQSCPDSRPAPFAQDRDNKKPDYNQQDEPLIALRCIRLAFHDCRDAESLDLPDAVTAPSLPRYLGLEEV